MLESENHIAEQENIISVYRDTRISTRLSWHNSKIRSILVFLLKKLSVTPNVENTTTHIVLNIIIEDSQFI